MQVCLFCWFSGNGVGWFCWFLFQESWSRNYVFGRREIMFCRCRGSQPEGEISLKEENKSQLRKNWKFSSRGSDSPFGKNVYNEDFECQIFHQNTCNQDFGCQISISSICSSSFGRQKFYLNNICNLNYSCEIFSIGISRSGCHNILVAKEFTKKIVFESQAENLHFIRKCFPTDHNF